MNRFLLVALSWVMHGCATSPESIAIGFQYSDNPDQQHIDMSYRNDSEVTVCLGPEFWPNEYGNIAASREHLILVVGQQKFNFEEMNLGYCLGDDCAIRVRPGEVIAGHLNYKDFKLPTQLYTEPKTLQFHPIGYQCRLHRGRKHPAAK